MRYASSVAIWIAVLAADTSSFAPAAKAQPSCGSETRLGAGETLADVAERCDVALEDLLEANPDLSTGTVPAGTEIDMPGWLGGDLLGRARDALREAGEEIDGAAERAGKSVSEFLAENPDLNRDILELGQRIGLPGVEAGAVAGADLTVSPSSGRPGDEVTIHASGLRGEADVVIGVGPPDSEYEVLERAITTASGRVEVTLRVPQWAADQQSLVFVVETDRVRLTSDPFDIVGE